MSKKIIVKPVFIQVREQSARRKARLAMEAARAEAEARVKEVQQSTKPGTKARTRGLHLALLAGVAANQGAWR